MKTTTEKQAIKLLEWLEGPAGYRLTQPGEAEQPSQPGGAGGL